MVESLRDDGRVDAPDLGSAILTEIEQLRAENRRLVAQVERHRLVTDHIPALIAYWDHEERCRFANQAYIEWFGYVPEKLLGKTMKEMLGEELYQKNERYIRGALEGAPQHFERDLVRRKYGDLRHTQASYIPDASCGQIRGFIVLVVDVTEAKHAELAAIAASREAAAASHLKSRFLANMSHEIRTPLSGVLGMLDLAIQASSDPAQRELLDAANDAANHLLSVLGGILDISKIEVGELKLKSAPFEIRSAIEHGLAAQVIGARKRGIEVSLFFDPGLPRLVLGDSNRVLQVLLNLFGNALKFTKEGSIRVSVRPDAQDEQLIAFEVADTGIGLRPEQLALIFLPFRQVDDSDAREFGGTGLGLTICRELTQMMGGTIAVESEHGKGSVFRFTARLARVNAKGAEEPPPPVSASAPGDRGEQKGGPAPVTGRRLRVLLAEDDRLNAMVATRVLQSDHCDVVHVQDGQSAIDEIGRGSFDVVFMDMQMPVMDGLTATRRIRALHPGSRARIVALTANATEEDMKACREAGMDSFLTKPIRKNGMFAILQKCRAGERLTFD